MTRKTFLYLWAASILVPYLAFTYSEFPNQIHWIFNIALTVLALLLLLSREIVLTGIGKISILMVSYFAAFYIVSFWEVFPGTTIDYGKFELINIVIAVNAFLIGRNFNQSTVIALHVPLALVIIIISCLQLILDQEQARFGYGAELMLCLPAAMLFGRSALVAVGIGILLSSQHKTPLIAALVALAAIGFMSRRGDVWPQGSSTMALRDAAKSRPLAFLEAAKALLFTSVFVVVFFQSIITTIARFLPDTSFRLFGIDARAEGVDLLREYVTNSALMLFPEYFVQGMGYMNFYIWTGIDTGLTYTTALNREVIGVALHNSYMTWFMEGGLLVGATIIVIFYQVARSLAFLVSNEASRAIGIFLVSWCFAELIFGTFHQLHNTVQFWITLGLIFGYHAQHTASRESFPPVRRS